MFCVCLLVAVIALYSYFIPSLSSLQKQGSRVNDLGPSSVLPAGGRFRGDDICQGYIDSSPVYDEEGKVKLYVRLQGCKDGEFLRPAFGRVQLTTTEGGPHFSFASIIRFKTRLRLPTDFNNPGGFNYTRYCKARGIDHLGYIGDPKWITVIGAVKGHHIRKFIERLREHISESLPVIKDDDIRGVAKALLIGDGSSITENVKDDFRRSGLMHLLVISGLHVAFIAMALFFVFKWIFILVPGFALKINILKPSAAFTILGVWFYAYLTGAEVSVIRAAIIATVYLAGIIRDRRQDIFTSLALAALIIIAASPYAIFDVSFQLSFVAVLAIAIIYPRLVERFSCLRPAPNEIFFTKAKRYALETAAVSVAATIGVTPLLSYYFHYSSLIGILANVIAVPWAGFIITPLSLIVSLSGGYFAELWSHMLIPLVKTASIASSFSRPLTLAVTPPWVAVVAFYGFILLVCHPATKLRRFFTSPAFRMTAVFVCFAVILSSFAIQHNWFFKGLKVTFLDVGQGSSIVVNLPTGKVMVIDGGGTVSSSFDIGKMVIAPYLWHEGITHIDRLVLTHAHLDHYKGLAYLAEEFSPEAIIWNGIAPSPSNEDDWSDEDSEVLSDWQGFVERIDRADVPFILPARRSFGGRWSKDENVEFFNTRSAGDNLNNASLVTKITYGDISFLLTGDIEEDAEKFLSKTLIIDYRSQITVLQISHHGSATSTTETLLNAFRPEYAVIQCGRNNRYGFPNKQVLERLRERGVKIFRTDFQGAITFSAKPLSAVNITTQLAN